MALLMKLPNVGTNKGKFVYKRRIPVDIRHLYPHSKEPFFETRFRVQVAGPDLVIEHSALQAAFVRMVKDALQGHPEAVGKAGIDRYIGLAWSNIDDPTTQKEKWEGLKTEAEELVRSVRALSANTYLGNGEYSDDGGDTVRRDIIAEELVRTGADPLLYKAVTQPDAEAPPATLADAVRVYAEEKIGDNPTKSARNTFNKIKRRLEASLGPLDQMALVDLKREHAKKVRDDLLKSPKKGGGTLSVASVEREINSIKSMVTIGIEEHDLKGEASNP